MRAHIVTCANKERYLDALDQMHCLRHKLFVEQMGWRALRSVNEREIDEYDDDDAVYLLTMRNGKVVGSIRLLPSWRRSLMADKLAEFIDGETPIGPDIWEWTRWAPGVGVTPRIALQSRSVLFAAAMEFAISRRVKMFTAVVDPKYIPLISDLGWLPERCGPVRLTAEGTPAVALKWRLGPADLNNIRQAVRVHHIAAVEAPLANGCHAREHDIEAFAELAGLTSPSAISAITQSILHATSDRTGEFSLGRA